MSESEAVDYIKRPTVILVLGMAGSGKTTFVQRLQTELKSAGNRIYTLNLDPAVVKLPYSPNIDIRDSVSYKDVMKEFQLGPNGGIITSLNLFATKFDQVLALLEKRSPDLDYIIVDTPGQIEVFSWSASGSIIGDSLSLSFPTITAYVMDSERCQSPITFMSNMTYACSMLYKTKLPFTMIFNKADVADPSTAIAWMRDFDSYLEAVQNEHSYMGSLSRSMCLALEEFYATLRHAQVSSITGEGFQSFIQTAVPEARREFLDSYVPYLEHRRVEMSEKRRLLARKELQDFEKKFEVKKRDDEEEEDAAELEAFKQFMREKK